MTPPIRPQEPRTVQVLQVSAYASSKAIQAVFKKAVSGPSPLNYPSSAFSLMNAQHEQTTQIMQIVTNSESSAVPLGHLSYNPFVKVPLRLYELGLEIIQFSKTTKEGLLGKIYSLSHSMISTANLISWQLIQTRSLLGYVWPSLLSDTAKVVFKNIGSVAVVLTSVLNVAKLITTSAQIHKLRTKYGAFAGRVSDYRGALNALKGLLKVSDEEILAEVKGEKEPFFKSYFDQKMKEATPAVRTQLGLAQPPDVSSFASSLSNPEVKSFLAQKFHIAEETLEGLSAEGFLGLVLYKSDTAIKKQEAFIKDLCETKEQGVKLKNMMLTLLKVDKLTSSSEIDEPTKRLLGALSACVNRRLFKELAVAISVALSLVASVVSVFAPAAIPAALAFWVLSNAINYLVSLREFEMAATEPFYDVSQNKGKWKLHLSFAVNLLAVLGVLAFMASPLGAGLSGFAIAAAVITMSVYTLYHLAMINKNCRLLMIKHASFIDRIVNQNVARFAGVPIAQEGDQEAYESLQKSALESKLLKLTLGEKKELATKLGINVAGIALFKVVGARQRPISSTTAAGQNQLNNALNRKFEEYLKQDFARVQIAYNALKAEQLQKTLQDLATT